MTNVTEMKFRYFSPVEGRVVQRFGSDSYIGASRGPKGYTINLDAVVAIPEAELAARPKSWRNLLKRGDLRERTREEYEAFQKKRQAKSEAIRAARKKPPTQSTDKKQPKPKGSKKSGGTAAPETE